MGIRNKKDALIVDDEPGVQDVLKQYLENMGCFRKIICAGDGVQALNMIENQSFEVVLLDLNMPKADGLKVAEQISLQSKGLQKTQPNNVVIVTGELAEDVLKKSIGMGVKNFIVKPFDEAQLQAKVLGVLKEDAKNKRKAA